MVYLNSKSCLKSCYCSARKDLYVQQQIINRTVDTEGKLHCLRVHDRWHQTKLFSVGIMFRAFKGCQGWNGSGFSSSFSNISTCLLTIHLCQIDVKGMSLNWKHWEPADSVPVTGFILLAETWLYFTVISPHRARFA